MTATQPPAPPRDSLAVTALYTAGAWSWGGFPCAELYATKATRNVFGLANLLFFVAKWLAWSRASLRHDLVHRHAAIDRVVRRAAPTGVLELAAGLSPRGAAFTGDDPALRWVEVDLPEMVSYKTALLNHTEAGRAVLARENLSRVAADVRETALADLLAPDGSTVVLAEGLLMYLETAEQADLARRVAAYLAEHGGTFAFDLVPPAERADAGAVGRWLGVLLERFTRGQGIVSDGQDRGALAAMLRDAGFDHVEIVEPWKVARSWDLPFPGRQTEQVVWVARKDPA